MATASWHLIAYDVRDPKRLKKTAKVLEGYGERVQFSIFRVRVTKQKLEKLRWELSEILFDVDDLLIIPICSQCSGKIPRLSQGNHDAWADEPPTFDIL